ncbi:MAG: hypothetical protein ACR2O4_10090, partial [Hyphomicrobiaceae bacterium]
AQIMARRVFIQRDRQEGRGIGMASSKKSSRKPNKRPTATIDLKAKDVSTGPTAGQTSDRPDRSESPTQPAPTAAQTARTGKPADTQAAPATPKAGTTAKPAASGADPVAAASSKKDPAKPAEGSRPHGRPRGDAAKGPESAKPAAAKPDLSSAAKTTAAKTGNGGLRGAFTHLAAGGLGGLLAMFGAQQYLGNAPAQPTSGTPATATISEAVEARLAALESSATSGASAQPSVTVPPELLERVTNLEALNETLAGIAETQNKLTGQTSDLAGKIAELADPAGGGAVELRTRLDAMEGTMSSLAKAAEGADNKAIPQLAALAARINDLQTELQARVAAGRKATVGDLEGRFAAIEETLTKSTSGNVATEQAIATLTGGNKRVSLAVETMRAETERLGKEITGVKSAVGEYGKRFDALDTSAAALVAGMEKNTGEIAALPTNDKVSAAIAPVIEKLGVMEEKVASALKREDARTNSARQIVLALELSNLRRALDRGQPVAGEIKRIKASAPQGIDLAPLDKLAATSVPTADQLASEFNSVAENAIRAETEIEGASAFDKLMANARSIVRVRKTGDVEGDTTEAIVARAEDDLKRSDIRSAVSEVQKLSGLAAEAASGWISKARDRLAVDAVLEQIEAGLKTSVSSSATN